MIAPWGESILTSPLWTVTLAPSGLSGRAEIVSSLAGESSMRESPVSTSISGVLALTRRRRSEVFRGADLRKAFPEGTPVTAKILETGDGRLRLSIKGAKDAEERAQFEDVRRTQQAPQSLGTLGDLLKKFNKK